MISAELFFLRATFSADVAVQLRQEPPAVPQVHSLRQSPRRNQFACPASVRYGSAPHKRERWPPSQSDRCSLVRRVPTELQLQVETGRSAHIWPHQRDV